MRGTRDIYHIIRPNNEHQGDDLMLAISRGTIPGVTFIHKFGENDAVGTSFVPVAQGGVYQMPTAAVSLEFVSSSAADAIDDVGMHEITIEGLDENWEIKNQVVAAHATDGTIAVAIPTTWLRVFRAFVSASGTYASATSSSHVGTITIRVASAGATWAVINLNTALAVGQTEIGLYTVPIGKTAYLTNAIVNVQATKIGSILFFQRPNADDVSTPFTGTLRTVFQLGSILGGEETIIPKVPIGPFVGPCDLGFLAHVNASTGEIDVDFELILIDN